jgi:hypothetical protein
VEIYATDYPTLDDNDPDDRAIMKQRIASFDGKKQMFN